MCLKKGYKFCIVMSYPREFSCKKSVKEKRFFFCTKPVKVHMATADFGYL